MPKLRFLGGVEEVGRSSIFLESIGGEGILLDSGVSLDHTVRFPAYVQPSNVTAIAISHCHLDHVGSAPLFFIGGNPKAIMTSMTRTLSRILLLDMLKIAKTYLPFDTIEVRRLLDLASAVQNRERIGVGSGGISVELFNAGHVIGASQVLIEADGIRTLYTGDMNVNATRTVPPADVDFRDQIDVLITESTYASIDHPSRDTIEKQFVEEVEQIVEEGGRVLVPAFGVGRSQEIIAVLEAHGFRYPVMLDGMARTVNDIFMSNLPALNEPDLFAKAVNSVTIMQSGNDRQAALGQPGVIVTPAGMLKGGPSVLYSEEIAKRPKDAIFLVSYQVEGTPGAMLLKEKVLPLGGKLVKVRARIKQFDFSSHNGREDYVKFAKTISPEYAFIVHGTRQNVEFLSKEMEQIGIPHVIKPKVGIEYSTGPKA